MAIRGAAKADFQRQYMPAYLRMRRAYASRSLRESDQQVLMLSRAGYLDQEMGEALAMSQDEIRCALSRVAEYLVPPIPPPSMMVRLGECLPFMDDRYYS